MTSQLAVALTYLIFYLQCDIAAAFSEGWLEISNGAICSRHGGGIFSADVEDDETVPSTVTRTGHGNHVVTYNTLAVTQAGVNGYKLTYTQVPC